MTASLGPAPGFERYPQHRIDIQASAARWQVRIGGELIAESGDTLALAESSYGPVLYFPDSDVHLDRLVATDSATTCPFKGRASYFRIDSREAGDDIAWMYPDTYDEVSSIAGHIAFYADRVELTQVNELQ